MILSNDVALEPAMLHDCELQELRFDVSDPHERRLTMVAEAPEEAPGRRVRIHASEVYLFRLTAWGHCTGKEVFASWTNGVSAATEQALQNSRTAGLAVPSQVFTVTFHSGSFFELVCRDLRFDILP